MSTTMSTVAAKEKFSELLNHVSHSKERVVLLRRGQPIVAVIPLEDLRLLEDKQDRDDVKEAIDALQEAKASGTVTIDELKSDTGTQL